MVVVDSPVEAQYKHTQSVHIWLCAWNKLHYFLGDISPHKKRVLMDNGECIGFGFNILQKRTLYN